MGGIRLMSTVMTMNNTKVIRGCDISYWQGNVDFAKMYKAGGSSLSVPSMGLRWTSIL